MHFTFSTFVLSALPLVLGSPADLTKIKLGSTPDLSKITKLEKIPDLTKIKLKDICKERPSLCHMVEIPTCQELPDGPIKRKWLEMGGTNGPLGCSYKKEPTDIPGLGQKQIFQNGALYIPTSFRTVYALTGAIYKAYKNPIETELGFPVSQYQNLVGGKGHFVLFQHGYIQDHPNTGVNIVKKTSSNQPGLKFQSEGGTPTFGRVLQVTYSGQMHINDDENWPSSDEFADYTLPPSPQNLLSSFPSITFPIIDRCAGDEVRVTLHVTADRVTAPEIPEGAVTINGNAKLYEGASCNTDDLETEQSFNFLLLPGQNQARDINLIDSSGDAQIHLNFNVVVL